MTKNDILPLACCILGIILLGVMKAMWQVPETCFLDLPNDPRAFVLAERMTRVLETRGYTVVERDLEGTECGRTEKDVVTIEAGLNDRERLFVLLHERAHTLLDHSESTPKNEVEAETVARIVTSHYDLDPMPSWNYIGRHMRNLTEKPDDRNIKIAYTRILAEI